MSVDTEVRLTPREETVLTGIVASKTYREIAAHLNVSYGLVRLYAKRLRRKLQVNSKVGLALWAERRRQGRRTS
jgi:DNA-binding CsgD family transcriptional regulator